jgi:hypothetical protein
VDDTTESMDDMSGRDLIGPIIGGVLGGLCILLILILLTVIVIIVKIVGYRKSRDKPTMSYTHQGIIIIYQLHGDHTCSCMCMD